MILLNLHLPQNNLFELDGSKIKQQCGSDPDMKNIHEFCSECGALKPEANAVLCQTTGFGNEFNDSINGQYVVSINVLFICVGVLRPSQQRGHVEPVS